MNANDIIEKCAEIAEAYADDQDKTVKASCVAKAIRALKSSLPAETVSEAMVEAARDAFDAAYAAEYIGGALGCRDNKDIALLAALEAALAHADDGWRPIESAPKNPVSVSVQSSWYQGEQHGPVILLGFGEPGFEQWETQVGWWQPHGDPCWRFLEDDGACDVQPTHWRSLPAPPKDGRE